MRIALPLLALCALAAGCGDKEDSCDEYVAYMCDCYPDDCENLKTTYEDADADLQDQCAIDLAEAQDEDQENGQDCSGSDDTAAAR